MVSMIKQYWVSILLFILWFVGIGFYAYIRHEYFKIIGSQFTGVH